MILSDSHSLRLVDELLKTNHVAFRPIDVKRGPDGAIDMADWYHPIIPHGEVDFRDPRRDHTHGRIWRVTAKNRPLVPRPKLVGATVPELLEHLKAPEQWTRHQAKRVLKELALHGTHYAIRATSASRHFKSSTTFMGVSPRSKEISHAPGSHSRCRSRNIEPLPISRSRTPII